MTRPGDGRGRAATVCLGVLTARARPANGATHDTAARKMTGGSIKDDAPHQD